MQNHEESSIFNFDVIFNINEGSWNSSNIFKIFEHLDILLEWEIVKLTSFAI